MAQLLRYDSREGYTVDPMSSSPTSTPASPWPTSPYSHGGHGGHSREYFPPAWAWGAQSRSQLDLSETAELPPKPAPTAWHEPPRPTRRLNRKLPPLMTESLEQLVLATPLPSPFTESLRAVPENAPPVPLRSPVRQLLAQQAAQLPDLHSMDHYPNMPKTPSNSSLSAALHTPAISRASTESASWQEHVVTPLSSGALHIALAPEAELRDKLDAMETEGTQTANTAKAFDPVAVPDVSALLAASDLHVVGEDGKAVRFGDIVSGTGRTLVVFTRHWLSPLCAQYLHALIAAFTPDVVARTRARVIVIGYGDPAAIRAVRRHFRCPFPMYADTSRALYATLGMLPRAVGPAPPYTYTVGNRVARAWEALALAARIGPHGLRAHRQLAGEFVFDGSLAVVLAHRMCAPGDRSGLCDLVAAVDGSQMTFVPKRHSSSRSQARTPKASISLPSLAGETAASAEESAHFDRQRASLLLARRGRPRMASASASEVGLVHANDVDAFTGEVRRGWARSMSA